jgi:hypothetical protein
VSGLKPKSTFHDDTPFDSDLHAGAGQVVKLVPIGGDTTSPTTGVLAGGNGAPTGSKTVIFISATDEVTWSTSYVIDATGCVAWRASVLDSGTGSCVVDGYSPAVTRKRPMLTTAKTIAVRYFFHYDRPGLVGWYLAAAWAQELPWRLGRWAAALPPADLPDLASSPPDSCALYSHKLRGFTRLVSKPFGPRSRTGSTASLVHPAGQRPGWRRTQP